MTISINQPYFFPYIGYYQLIYNSDYFVSFDNVNYSNIKWVSSNFIQDKNFNKIPLIISLEKKSQNKKINELEIYEHQKNLNKLYKSLKMVYNKSENFEQVFGIVENSIKHKNISEVNYQSLIKIFEYLGVEKKIIKSSELDLNYEKQNKVEKLVEIINKFNCKTYYNLIGGQKIYQKDDFNKHGVNIYFLNSNSLYRQSFLHLLFTKNKYDVIEELKKFTLI